MPTKQERLIRELLDKGYIDNRIAKAMRRFPRELFVPEGYKEHSYADYPLPIGLGQTISAPSIVGLMLRLADLKNGQNVLEIGTGSGWLTALASELVGDKGRVVTVERFPSLSENAEDKLKRLGVRNVIFRIGDGSCGWKEFAPYDRIIVTAGLPRLPDEMKEQLTEEGIIVAPIGAKYMQDLVVYRRKGDRIDYALPVMFVPVIGRCGFKEL